MDVTVAEFEVADAPEAWRAAGFTTDADETCRIGTVRIRFIGTAGGIVGWSLRGVPASVTAIDGVPTAVSDVPLAEPGVHPNGVTHIDHVVLMTPDLDRSLAALATVGLAPRRERDAELGGAPIRQVFYRLGEVVLEVIGTPDVHGEGPASFWGLTHTVADIDATAGLLGANVGRVKDAVQPGRRIATLRHEQVGMSVRTAFISPR